MASTFYSIQVTAGDVPRAVSPGVYSVYGEYEISAALVINDVIEMCKVPIGARIIQVLFGSDDLDTHTTPTIIMSVGDGSSTARFITGATIGQAGGVTTSTAVTYGVAGGMGYKYTANDTIDIKVTTAPATGATSGTLWLIVVLAIDD